MDALRMFFLWEKQRQHSGHGDAGVGDTDENFLRGGERAGYKDRGRVALFGGHEVAFLLSEGQVPRSGAVGRRQAAQFNGAVANDLAFELFRDLGSGKW